MKRAALLLAIAAAAVPGVASADFLYNAIPPDRMPYVFVIMDNSYSMVQTDGVMGDLNPYGLKDIDPDPFVTNLVPMTRLDSAKEALRSVLDDIEGVGVGFIHFYPNGRNVDLNGVNGTDPTKPAYDPLSAAKVAADLAHSELGRSCGACLVTYPDGVNDRTRILAELDTMVAETDTALAVGLTFAGKMISRVAKGYTLGGAGSSTLPIETPDTVDDERLLDEQLSCRRYFVILMTDGEDTCSNVWEWAGQTDPITGQLVGNAACVAELAGSVPTCAVRAGHVATLDALNKLRDLDLGSNSEDKMVATFIIGFGRGANVSFTTTMNAYARAGRTTYDPDTKTFLCMGPNGSFGNPGDGPCLAGPPVGDGNAANNGALMATNQAQLREAFKLAFDAALAGEFVGSSPIISTVPQEVSEIGRVARNFLAYGAFRMPRSKGVLYGMRLFKETGAATNVFQFTDLRPVPAGDLDMSNCGNSTDNPCVFEAGSMLTDRVAGGSSDRRLFTARVSLVKEWGGGEEGTTYVLEPTAVAIPTPSAAVADIEKGIPLTAWSSFMGQSISTFGGATSGDILDNLPPGLVSQAGARFATIGNTLNTFYADASSEAFHRGVSAWLHGLPPPGTSASPADPTTWDRAGRRWALGDILHGSVAMVGPPGGGVNTSGYADFRGLLASRPPMIYVGANDGMIHAFYAAADLSGANRWAAGEEAWAFLPPSQFANTAYNVLLENDRFDSEDLSCNINDVLVDPSSYSTRTCTAASCSCAAPENEKCGWRTVLTCGQGWGGNWYTSLDITWANHKAGGAGWKPTPVPMWEFTNFSPDGAAPDKQGMGRSWAMPGTGYVNDDGTLRSIALLANGYNASQRSCDGLQSASKCKPAATSWHGAWAALNLPYLQSNDSLFPRYGEGVDGDAGNLWAVDLATGELLKKFSEEPLGAIIADVPMLDSDGDRLVDAGYPATWGADSRTRVGRVFFPDVDPTAPGRTKVNLWGICPADDSVINRPGSKPFTTGVAVIRHPYKRNEAYLFAGTGVDKESGQQHPDLERFAGGNDWKFYGVSFHEDGSSTCAEADDICPGSGGTEKFELGKDNHEERLVGAPTMIRQADGGDWLVFTTMTPPASFCGSPTTYLWCMDVTNPQACGLCGSLDGTVGAEQSTEIAGAPTSPATADGQIYTVGSDGPNRTTPGGTGTGDGGNNQSGTTGPGGGDTNGDGVVDGNDRQPGGPNQNRSRYLPVSFREIF